MKISAGLLLIKNKKILLVHPTGATWKNSFGIPKGLVDTNEDLIDAAIRETREEVGISINRNLIKSPAECIDYKHNTGKVFKKVYYFVVNVNSLDLPDKLPKEQLQLSEVDYAEFYDKETATKYIMPLQAILLKHI